MPVTYKSWHDSPDRGYWDQSMVDDLLTSVKYENVLVTPGHWRDATEINQWLSLYGPAVVWITSDEEGQCPFWDVHAPVWKQTPNPQLARQPDRALPLGYTPHTRPVLAELGMPLEKKGWTFSGQVTNPRRESAMEALRKLGDPLETDTFASGLSPKDYIETLWRAEWVPCPAGNVRPETFRMWEALEAGAVPILDATSPAGDMNYWPRVLGDHPLPVLEDWSQVDNVMSEAPDYSRVGAWYTRYKRELRRDLWQTWCDISEEPWIPPQERITVIITASPIPSHPSRIMLADTVKSVIAQLPNVEICIAFDGARTPNTDYEEHIRQLAWHANQYWPQAWIWYSAVWKHQAGTIRDVLPHIDTNLVLMLEHDTPLTGEIPWAQLSEVVLGGGFNSLRFHHEAQIPAEHAYLMQGSVPDKGIRMTRTKQYSQRPHLASTQFYRDLLGQLPIDARTYVEDWAYGIVEQSPWEHHRLGIFTPEGDIKRSYHLDGRAGAAKEEMWW